MSRKIIIILCAVFCFLQTEAAHLKGGYIEYEYLGPNASNPKIFRFRIKVYQYLDCNSAGGQIDSDVNLAAYSLDDNSMYSMQIVPLAGTTIAQRREFKCIDIPPNICYRIDYYETNVDLAVNVNGYQLTVQRCCRISGINNIANSVNSGVTYSVKLLTNGTNAFVNNSSPVFVQNDTALVCANNGFTLPFSASDPDNDSLVYSFTPGLNTPTREAKPLPPLPPPFPDLTYADMFNPDQPMGNSVSINRRNGLISGIAPNVTGDYVLAVLVEEYRNGVKIGDIRKEIHVTVTNCTSPQAILPPVPPGIVNCNNFTVSFSNLSSSSGITSYYWDFGVPNRSNDTSNLATPSFIYPDTGVYKVKLVINRQSLCSDSTYTEVRIFPGFEANFDHIGVCNLLPYNFQDKSFSRYGSVNSWRWDFGVGGSSADSSTQKNPQFLFSQVGTYNVTLKVTSTLGCEDTVIKVVNVSDKPTIQLVSRDTLMCNRDTIMLQALTPGNYTWSPNYNILQANTATPRVFPRQTTTYHVTLDNNGCTGTDSVKVNVVDFVTLFAGNDSTICLTDQIELRPFSNATKYSWAPAATLDDFSIKNPKARPTAAQTTYTVTASIGSCVAVDDLVINTLPYPSVNAGLDSTICFAEQAFLRGNSNGDIIKWAPASLVQNSSRLNTSASPTATQAFILTAQNMSGCTKPISDTVLITVLPKIAVDAGPDTSLVLDQPLQLSGTSNATSYSWSPAFGLSNTQILNPILAISRDMTDGATDPMTYTLTASNAVGCTASSEVRIKFFKVGPSIFVPSGFTPNGDGLNDVIKPILAGMQSLTYFRIYNRYGQPIFETKQVGRGWDGSIKGQLQATGVYVFDCQAIAYNGSISKLKGTFVLIR